MAPASNSTALPWVLAGVIGITAARGLFIYLHQTTATRVVLRMITDLQKAAFAHLMNADYARLTESARSILDQGGGTSGDLLDRLQRRRETAAETLTDP